MRNFSARPPWIDGGGGHDLTISKSWLQPCWLLIILSGLFRHQNCIRRQSSEACSEGLEQRHHAPSFVLIYFFFSLHDSAKSSTGAWLFSPDHPISFPASISHSLSLCLLLSLSGPLPLSLLVSVSIDTSVCRSLCLREVTRPMRLFHWLLSLSFVAPFPHQLPVHSRSRAYSQNSFFLSVASLHSIRLIISHHFMLSASASHWLLNHQATPNPTLRRCTHTHGHT